MLVSARFVQGAGEAVASVVAADPPRSSARSALARLDLPGEILVTWFLIGPAVWFISSTTNVLAPATALRTFAELIGCHIGEGYVLAGLAGFWALRSLGRPTIRRTA